MKSTPLWIAAALAAQRVSSHATFQDLWVNGVDEIGASFPFLHAPLIECLPGSLCPSTTFKFASHRRYKY